MRFRYQFVAARILHHSVAIHLTQFGKLHASKRLLPSCGLTPTHHAMFVGATVLLLLFVIVLLFLLGIHVVVWWWLWRKAHSILTLEGTDGILAKSTVRGMDKELTIFRVLFLDYCSFVGCP